MKVAITGGTGFVGTSLVKKLQQGGDKIIVFTRNQKRGEKIFPSSAFPNVEIVPYNSSTYQGEGLDNCEAVVNLAGESISERWTPEYKQAILSSRQSVTKNIVEAISKANPRPSVLISASAIGYYGTSETATFDESSPSGNDFLAKVCQIWEAEAEKVKEYGVRLVILRLGIVLGNGGALGKMINPFKMFAGGPIGSGNQWFSWIHIDDLVNLMIEAIKNPEFQGVYNATSPNPVRMNQLCQSLGETMGRPSWLPVPAIALELLLGEGAQVVLEGQQVLPKQTQNTVFKYQYPEIKPALQEIIRRI